MQSAEHENTPNRLAQFYRWIDTIDGFLGHKICFNVNLTIYVFNAYRDSVKEKIQDALDRLPPFEPEPQAEITYPFSETGTLYTMPPAFK